MSRALYANQRGFSLAEVLVSMGVMLVVLAGTFEMMAGAMRDTQTAKQVTNLNANLRSTMDVIVRDVIQLGQGLPGGNRISIPNGPGATLVNRPGPLASTGCAGAARFPAGAWIPAVTSGPGLGPRLGTDCSDVITMLAADGLVENVQATLAANGTTATIDPTFDISGGADGRANDLRAGDLLMVQRVNATALMHITAVNGDQTVTFSASDSLNLNQFDPTRARLGTINQLIPVTPVGQPAPPLDDYQVTRIRMITYYVDALTDPQNPRVVRRIGNGPANAVGIGVEMLRFTYDITDNLNNPAAVRLLPADLAAGGACGANPCSPNQIRLVNVTLAMRSRDKITAIGDYHRNTLYTQVSARSLSFFDQYR